MARRGGTLTAVLAVDMPGFDPIQLQGAQNWGEAFLVPAVYDALFYLDAANRLRPKIGRSLTSDDGGATWILTLRDGVRFADGTSLDAEAVRFNWARLADPANRASAAEAAGMIAAMEVIDPLTLRVRLHAPAPRWSFRAARSLSSIGSPAAIAAAGQAFSSQPVGAGPFRLVEWVRGDQMRFERNPGYWQAGKPYLDELVVITGLPDAASKFAAMQSGRAQVSMEPLGPNLAPYHAAPERFELLGMRPAGGGVAVNLNLSRPPFDDVRVRRALALAFDSAEYVELRGLGDPAMVMTTVDFPGTAYAAPDVRLPGRDLAQAQALIDEVVAETGQPIRFRMDTYTNEGHQREANCAKIIWEKHLRNVEVEVVPDQAPTVLAKYRSGDYQAGNYAFTWSDPTLDLAPILGSSSPQNVMRYKNPAVDAALERLAGLTDDEEIAETHREILRRLLEDWPIYWMSYKESFHAIDRQKVGAWPLYYSLRPMIEDAWLKDAGGEEPGQGG
jgi:peptide/nickel transport system substrate-binding protein